MGILTVLVFALDQVKKRFAEGTKGCGCWLSPCLDEHRIGIRVWQGSPRCLASWSLRRR